MTRPRVTRFGLGLAGIALAGLALRLYYGLHVMGGHRFSGDASEFHLLARTIVDTHSYLQPFPWLIEHDRVPTAEKPPLYPTYLSLWTWLGASSYKWHLAASSLLGAGAVATIGAIGRRAAGARAGLIAAGLAAVYPELLLQDASLRSESLYVPLVALALLAAYHLAERPTARRGALLGVAIGLAALTRSEGVFLVVLLALPALWLGASRGARLRPALAVVAGCAVLLVPWLARNWIQFDRPTAISTNEGGLLAGANCDLAYHGELIGTWACFPDAPIGPEHCNRDYYREVLGTQACYPVGAPRNEAAASARLRSRALRYARDHAGRVPAVASVRLLRTWELWDPRDHAAIEAFYNDRNPRWNRWAQRSFYVLALLAVAGAVVLRRRRVPLRLLLALPALVSLVAVTSYGSTRFRAAAEIALVVLAAAALDALLGRLRPAGEPADGPPGNGRPRSAREAPAP
jgi:hypothetical protein